MTIELPGYKTIVPNTIFKRANSPIEFQLVSVFRYVIPTGEEIASYVRERVRETIVDIKKRNPLSDFMIKRFEAQYINNLLEGNPEITKNIETETDKMTANHGGQTWAVLRSAYLPTLIQDSLIEQFRGLTPEEAATELTEVGYDSRNLQIETRLLPNPVTQRELSDFIDSRQDLG